MGTITTSGNENPAFILVQNYPAINALENIRYDSIPLEYVKDRNSVGMWNIKYKADVAAA
jgi:hypothetical protein